MGTWSLRETLNDLIARKPFRGASMRASWASLESFELRSSSSEVLGLLGASVLGGSWVVVSRFLLKGCIGFRSCDFKGRVGISGVIRTITTVQL